MATHGIRGPGGAEDRFGALTGIVVILAKCPMLPPTN